MGAYQYHIFMWYVWYGIVARQHTVLVKNLPLCLFFHHTCRNMCLCVRRLLRNGVDTRRFHAGESEWDNLPATILLFTKPHCHFFLFSTCYVHADFYINRKINTIHLIQVIRTMCQVANSFKIVNQSLEYWQFYLNVLFFFCCDKFLFALLCVKFPI